MSKYEEKSGIMNGEIKIIDSKEKCNAIEWTDEQKNVVQILQ